ncbi:hypothetical protein ACS0TY_016465 [Phlomoides rotata]
MGHSSKKKPGRRQSQPKDHHSLDDDSEILTEEITAFSALSLFEVSGLYMLAHVYVLLHSTASKKRIGPRSHYDYADCAEASETLSVPYLKRIAKLFLNRLLIRIKLRLHPKDTGYEDSDVSAFLSVRCLQGYPYKCPKLQILPEKGLTKNDADNLFSLLYDQANSNAREGRVMINNLVEAAQEFLSEIIPQGQSHGSIFLDFSGYGIEENSKAYDSLTHTLVKESEDETKSNDLSSTESDENGIIGDIKGEYAEDDLSAIDNDGMNSYSESSLHESAAQVQSTLNKEMDLLLAHLLRIVCAPNGALADALPDITSEVLNLGILSQDVRDVATQPSSSFDKTFDCVFGKHRSSSKISGFWNTCSDFRSQSSSVPNSRYLSDFEELKELGHGGFGRVVLCKNKLDGWQYAVKKIRLEDKTLPVDDRILREVEVLSQLQHRHVVRYYQAWYEAGDFGNPVNTSDSTDEEYANNRTPDFIDEEYSNNLPPENENKLESTYLYIQMEYCPRTLGKMFDSYNHLDKKLALHLFRQIVEGLVYIHGQGVIHRDLTPNNIFLDARNNIKIGDFGCAKFLRSEQLDQDVNGTNQIGTYFYKAPEIEQGLPKIDEKADMYSLGVVFFELWHPFATAMERHVVLSDLKLKGELPSNWVTQFPEQASLLLHLMSQSPSDRPSATELLNHFFPALVAFEMFDRIEVYFCGNLGTEVLLLLGDFYLLSLTIGRLKSVKDDTSSIIFTDADTVNRDLVVDIVREVYKQHCAKHMDTIPMRILDDYPQEIRNTAKLLSPGGDMIERCHELRIPFAIWIIKN